MMAMYEDEEYVDALVDKLTEINIEFHLNYLKDVEITANGLSLPRTLPRRTGCSFHRNCSGDILKRDTRKCSGP